LYIRKAEINNIRNIFSILRIVNSWRLGWSNYEVRCIGNESMYDFGEKTNCIAVR
jgi:hypothetical protein